MLSRSQILIQVVQQIQPLIVDGQAVDFADKLSYFLRRMHLTNAHLGELFQCLRHALLRLLVLLNGHLVHASCQLFLEIFQSFLVLLVSEHLLSVLDLLHDVVATLFHHLKVVFVCDLTNESLTRYIVLITLMEHNLEQLQEGFVRFCLSDVSAGRFNSLRVYIQVKEELIAVISVFLRQRWLWMTWRQRLVAI